MGDYTRFTYKPAKRYSGVLMQQGRTQTDADWNEEIEILKRRWEIQAADTFGRCAVPKATTPQAFKIAPLPGPDLSIGAGRMYVDGLLAEIFDNEQYTYKNQPYYPVPPSLPTGNTKALVYLDVWDREVTYIEDKELLEVALGGPDTTTRIQTVWQAKVYAMGTAICDSLSGLPLIQPSTGGLSTRAQAVPASDNPCIVSETGGYRGLENRLYRVEIHDPGSSSGLISNVKFKWSRDNASLVSSVNHIASTGTQTILNVSRIGRDSVMRFQAGDWIEVLDDYRELMGQSGEMARIAEPPDEANLTMKLDRIIPSPGNLPFGSTDQDLGKRHTRIRKWDEKLGVDANGLLSGSNQWIALEDGVEIQFNPGSFKVGDFWVFAARTADGSVGELNAASPRGIIHHYCQLATIIISPGSPAATPATARMVAPSSRPVEQVRVIDCRHLWPDASGCCCIITVGNDPQDSGDFPDLESAVEALPYVAPDQQKLVQICLLPGEYVLSKSIGIERDWVTVRGCGRSSHIASNRHTLVISGKNCCLESLYITGDSSEPIISVYGQDCLLRGNEFVNTSGYALQTGSANPVAGLIILDNSIVAAKGIDIKVQKALVARNHLQRGPLSLRVESDTVRVEENEITDSSDAGIFLGTTIGGESSLRLSAIEIAGNNIVNALGSGIATATFDSNRVSEILVDGLRIVGNQIVGCVGASAPTGTNRPTFGGIILASANHLLIRNNRIENNGQNATVPICGIYVEHSKGFEASGNHLLNNGPPWDEKPIVKFEGGILALDASVTTEIGRSLNPSENNRFLPGDGFPAALISVNTVVTHRGLALYLEGAGPIAVQGNSMTSRSLTQISTQTTADGKKVSLQVGAVVIENSGTASFDPKVLSTLGFTPMLSGGGSSGSSETIIADGRVQFVGNSVTLDLTQAVSQVIPQAAAGSGAVVVSRIPTSFFSGTFAPSQPQPQPQPQLPNPFPAAVWIISQDDVNASENQIGCHLGTVTLGTDLMVYGTTAREIGNGLMETPKLCSYSLLSVGLVNTCADNQGTHCIIPSIRGGTGGNLLVDRDNIVLLPDPKICPSKMRET